jgi:rod shape-determining protein MreD
MSRNRSLIFLIFCVLFAIVLQASVFPCFALFGAKPDLVLLLVVSTGLRLGYRGGAAMGFIAGLLLGCFSLSPCGAAALIYGVAGFLSGVVRNRTYPDEIVIPLETTLGATLVTFLLSYWILKMFPLPVHLAHLKLRLVGQVIYDLAFIIPVHRLTGWVLPPRRWDSFS